MDSYLVQHHFHDWQSVLNQDVCSVESVGQNTVDGVLGSSITLDSSGALHCSQEAAEQQEGVGKDGNMRNMRLPLALHIVNID